MSDREDSPRASRSRSHGSDRSHSRKDSKSRSRSRSKDSRRSRSRSDSRHRRTRSRSHSHRSPRSHSRGRKYRSRSRSPYNSSSRRRKYSRSRSTSRDRRRDDRHGDSRYRSRSPMSRRKRHVGTREAPKSSRCLGVFGLSLYTQERELKDVFNRYGPVEQLNIVYDHHTGKSRGFAFLTMRHLSDAEEAKERAPGTEIDGHKIRVDYSITERAHTPTPGIYLGKPTTSRYSNGSSRRGSDHYSRRSPSPYHRRRSRYSRSRSRSRSYSPRLKTRIDLMEDKKIYEE